MLTSCAIASGANAANVLSHELRQENGRSLAQGRVSRHARQTRFSLDWDECRDYAFVDAKYQLMANLVDSEPNDEAVTEFTQNLRFSLAGIECRPVKLTIRTSPGFNRTIVVPAL